MASSARQRTRLAGLGLLVLLALLVLAAFVAALRPAAAPTSFDTFHLHLDDPRLLRVARLAIVDAATPPGDDAPWQPVQLPETWRAPERWQQGSNGWYRFTVPGPAPAEPTSVYLWRFSMNAAVWFNGEWVGDGGSFDEPVARNWNRPLLFALAAAMWRSGENVLDIRLRVYPGFGHMMPPALGPTALLRPDYEQRYFAQITLSEMAAGITLFALLTALVLWAIERSDPAHPFLVGLCATWLIYACNSFLRDIPVPAGVWWWMVHTTVDLTFALNVFFYLRLAGERRPRLERLLVAAVACAALLYAVWPLPLIARWNPVLHGVMTLGVLWLVGWMAGRLLRRPSIETALYTALLATTVAGGLYDQLLNALLLPELWRQRFYVVHLMVPLVFIVFVAHLALRVVRGVQGVRAANEGLEARVQQASSEIASAYERERALLAERSAAVERERIYRDLHDNLGARLLTLVHTAPDQRQQGLARDALAEMRTIIAASQVDGGRLADLASEWRVEAELRAEDAGCRVAWQVDGDAALSGRQRYQLECIVRELVSNALEHGGGSEVRVQWQVEGEALRLEVADDGRGLPPDAQGQGLAGVAARAADLGGTARWAAATPHGTCCTVSVTLEAAP